jgi:hypothetical protein
MIANGVPHKEESEAASTRRDGDKLTSTSQGNFRTGREIHHSEVADDAAFRQA